MAGEADYLRLLRKKAERILARSPGLESPPSDVTPLDPAVVTSAHSESAQLEAVVRWYRPVLAVTDDRFVISTANPGGDPRFRDPNEAAAKSLLDALEKKRPLLDPVIRSVGRIELVNNARRPWVGTGWIIGSDLGSDIVVTNAHVGELFGMRSGAKFVFRPGVPDITVKQSARIDFREEVGPASAREFPITEIIWISDKPGLDMSLLRVARASGVDRIDPPVTLSATPPSPDGMVAVIGYPGGNDGYDSDAFRKLFGETSGTKRFSPGFYDGLKSGSITYDCSTVPGSSGSVVLDVDTGHAVGLHYAGTALVTNYAVPVADLARILKDRPWQGETVPSTNHRNDAGQQNQMSEPLNRAMATGVSHAADGSVTLTLPLEITVRLGGTLIGAAKMSPSPVADRTDRESAMAVAGKVRQRLAGDASVLSVNAGYLFRDGVITDDYGVIVGVLPGAALDGASHGLDPRIDGVEVAVELAPPRTVVSHFAIGLATEAAGDRHARYERDLEDARFNLDPVEDDMTITLHVSPEAGWPVLKQFLAEPNCDRLTIGMYNMTAPHIVDAIEEIAARPKTKITLTMDRQRGETAKFPDDTQGPTKKYDRPEAETLEKLADIAGSRFKWAPASLGANNLFEKAYHIKVAVWSKSKPGGELDDKVFWLSSGNWQSSNQAPLEHDVDHISDVAYNEVKEYNREWHAVVRHKGLAATFRNHLEQDYEDNAAVAAEEAPIGTMPDILVPLELLTEAPRARVFKPFPPLTLSETIKVQPLLTPDNYPEVIAELIAGARDRVLFENQSFSFWSDIVNSPEHFLKLAKVLKDRQKKIRDVRIIFRSGYGKEHDVIRQLKEFGIKADSDHLRYFDKCHTKGIVIDDEIAILGSQNWTGAGTGPNRDASLVIWHKKANDYFAKLFEYDWQHVAVNHVREHEAMPALQIVPAGAEAPTPRGYRRIPFDEYLGET